jgi:membrane protein YqaA with SNARE-associated domain
MNWPDLVCFLALAVLCNTAFPLPFDPVLIHFATHQSSIAAWIFALSGSACAGLGAVVDVRLAGWLRARVSDRWIRWLPHWQGKPFYAIVFLFAVSPLPFSIVRLAALRRAPHAIPYGLAVFLGRLPRYLLIVALWPLVGLPPGTSLVLLGVMVVVSATKLFSVPRIR